MEDAHLLAIDIHCSPCRPCSPQRKPRYQPPHLRRRSSSSSGAGPPACHMLYQTVLSLSSGFSFPLSDSCEGLRLATNTTAQLHDGTCLLQRLAMSSRCASPLRPCSLLHKLLRLSCQRGGPGALQPNSLLDGLLSCLTCYSVCAPFLLQGGLTAQTQSRRDQTAMPAATLIAAPGAGWVQLAPATGWDPAGCD